MTTAKRVLIVEDEKPLSHALQLKLTKEGFVAVAVYNGQECLDILKKEDFDAILLDLMMPVVDGFHVLEEIGRMPGKHPIIYVLSNLGQPEDKEKAKVLGVHEFFVKADTPLNDIIRAIKRETSK